MQKRFRRFWTTLRERGSVSYAKIATAGGFCDIDLIVVKATAPYDVPVPEPFVNELLKIFSISPSSYRAFTLSFTRRFGRTRCWRVALKCLVLVHRLLQSLPEDSPLRAELLLARANGLLPLYPCHFRDSSSSYSDDYTVFIRSYAQFIDEALCLFSLESTTNGCQQDRQELEEEEDDDEHEEDEELLESFLEKMREIGRNLEGLPQLQSLIDRVMDCRPTGPAASNFLVQLTMEHMIRDSFVCYATFRKEIDAVLENLFQMPYRSCISAFGIYKKAALQASQLSEFYEWCKSKALCGIDEYPFIDRIPQIQIQALEAFLNGMWQLTELSSSATSPSSIAPSCSSFTEDSSERTASGKEMIPALPWHKTEEKPLLIKYNEEEEEPLMRSQEDDTENDDWESVLDASVNLSPTYKTYNGNVFYPELPVTGRMNSSSALGYIIDSKWDHPTAEKNQLKLHSGNRAMAQCNPFIYQYGAHGGSLIMM